MNNSERMEAVADARESVTVDEAGETAIAGRLGGKRRSVAEHVHDPANPTHRDLGVFAQWRESKCIPRDMTNQAEHRQELIQGTLELTGEVGEVGDLVRQAALGVMSIKSDEFRAKLIDECGDVLFTASWLGDAWGGNPFRDGRLTTWAHDFGSDNFILGYPTGQPFFESVAFDMGVQAGLLANSAKKVVCQMRAQDIGLQQAHIEKIIIAVAVILVGVRATVFDAMARNIEKIDTRWPPGAALTGGGNRTGKGA